MTLKKYLDDPWHVWLVDLQMQEVFSGLVILHLECLPYNNDIGKDQSEIVLDFVPIKRSVKKNGIK